MSNEIISTRIPGNGVTRRVRGARLLATVVGALAACAAIAGPKLGTIEECLESGTTLVSLPGVAGGMLTVKECTACDSQRLTFDANTRYFIGKQPVTYARLRAAAAMGFEPIGRVTLLVGEVRATVRQPAMVPAH